ncbi:glycosyltransferase family 4 protein [Actinoplanes solisilvae]|uniref:glycosyltransferase family 4 protein n=1 Tax=Actinoplanes solisilvae TaxID=2486853 RepID=UPI000FD6BF11|nr:glycosyltransferase family 4 protein [Actinoplanes solisilvae]
MPNYAWPTIVQVGPDPTAVGGIATVIRTYVSMLSEQTTVRQVTSWRPGARGRSAIVALDAARQLAALRTHRHREGVLVHVHVSQRGSFGREGALIQAVSALDYPVVVTVHGSQFVATSEQPSWRMLYSRVLRRADAVAVLNDEALAVVRDLAPRTPVTLLPNPGPVRPEWAPADDAADPIVLFAGEVSRRKGVDVLLRAWPAVTAAVPGARLMVAGPPGGIDVDGVPGVRWLGAVSAEEIRKRLGEARVAVLPSRAEGMPMFVLEAMAAARPVVGSTVGAMPHLLAGVGTVVDPGDAERLADALIAYLCDPERARRDGAAGRAEYLRSHSPEVTMQRLAAFYRTGAR